MKIRFDPPEKKPTDRDQGVKVNYVETRRAAARWRWYLVLFIIASPLVYFFYTILQAVMIVEADGYIQLDKIAIHSPGSGRIEKIFVNHRDKVISGQALLKLNNASLVNSHRRLSDEIEALRREGSIARSPSEKRAVFDRIDFSNNQRDYYERRWLKYEALYFQGAATESELNTSRAQYEDALNTASLQVEKLNAPPVGLRLQGVKLRSLDLELAAVNDQINLQLISAPKESIVTDIFVHEGGYVSTGTLIANLASQDKISIMAFLAPRFSDYAKIAQSGTVRFPNGDKIKAHISELPELTGRLPSDASTVFSKRPVMILVKLELDEPLVKPLPDGLPVKVRFHFNWE